MDVFTPNILQQSVKSDETLASFSSDHSVSSALQIMLSQETDDRWKFNCKLLWNYNLKQI